MFLYFVVFVVLFFLIFLYMRFVFFDDMFEHVSKVKQIFISVIFSFVFALFFTFFSTFYIDVECKKELYNVDVEHGEYILYEVTSSGFKYFESFNESDVEICFIKSSEKPYVKCKKSFGFYYSPVVYIQEDFIKR